jgi:hypothetical protein
VIVGRVICQGSNWIPTMAKKPYIRLRLYGPEQAFWDKTFTMPDIDLLK